MRSSTELFESPFVIARADDTLLAIPSTWATEMFVCPEYRWRLRMCVA